MMRVSFLFFGVLLCFSLRAVAEPSILNASYDATREFYHEYNKIFAADWQNNTGEKINIHQSHGGSSKQARAVIEGLEADVVTLATAYDVQSIVKHAKLIAPDWQNRLPHQSAPYTSTVIFLVRKGNPKNIKNWEDLVKPNVSVITPNPKTSGGACWSYLAAWGHAFLTSGKDEKVAKDFITRLYKNVPILDSGARAATTTFVEREIGDVLISWESEILLSAHELGKDKFEIVMPALTILTQPVVSVVDQIANKHGTRHLAEAYLKFLYSEQGQEIAAKHYFRPINPSILKKYEHQFPSVKLFTLREIIGDWEEAYKIHFAPGGLFDQIYQLKE